MAFNQGRKRLSVRPPLKNRPINRDDITTGTLSKPTNSRADGGPIEGW